MTQKRWKPRVFNRPGLELSTLQCVLCIVCLCCLRASSPSTQKQTFIFYRAEQTILFAILFSGALQVQNGTPSQALSVAGVFFSCLSAILQLKNRAWASATAACLYGASVITSTAGAFETFAQGAAGSFYGYAAALQLLEQSQSQDSFFRALSLLFSLVTAVIIARNSFAAAAVQLAFFAVLEQPGELPETQRPRQIAIGASVLFLAHALSSAVFLLVAKWREGQARIRKLQSHAVMNAYVTAK